MGRNFFSYHLDENEDLKVNLHDYGPKEYGLNFGNSRIVVAGSLDQLHRIISKAEEIIEAEEMILNQDAVQEKQRAEGE